MTDQVTADFEARVDRWVLERVRCDARTFASLVCALQGVYPNDVRTSLARLASRGDLRAEVVAPLLFQATQDHAHERVAVRSVLPTPHPLDFDWRFAESATERLLAEVVALARPPGAVVFLGAPSVVPAAVRRLGGQVIALVANAAVARGLEASFPGAQIFRCDVVRDAFVSMRDMAAAVVIDPPWYPEYLSLFLWVGSQLCRFGGHVLVSLPPVGTRPGIEEERRELLASAETFGLQCVRLDGAALSYVSPLFERNALRAAGILGVPLEWRRGDLAVFMRTKAKTGPRPVMPLPKDTWCDTAAEGVRVRIRAGTADGFPDPALIPIVPGDILPTVSRRDPRRGVVDVWTAGNRVFACRGVGVLTEIIAATAFGDSPVDRLEATLGRGLDSHEAAMVGAALGEVAALLDVERADVLEGEQDANLR